MGLREEIIRFITTLTPTPFQIPLLALPTSFPPLVATLLLAIITAWVSYDRTLDLVLNPPRCLLPVADEVCDIVVAGGGTAGIVVATRLSNNTKGWTICVIEAGGNQAPVNQIPILDANLCYQPPNNWIYHSEPQTDFCLNCDNQSVVTQRGMALGGSSVMNFMMYVRGDKGDYDNWAQLLGDPDWNYTNVLPFFKLSEDYQGNWPQDTAYHGTGGLVQVSKYDYQPGADQFLAAALERGYKIGDYNGANQSVFSNIDATIQDGRRESTIRAYYTDTGKSPNLKFINYANVSKILFEGNRAVGVQYIRGNCTNTIRARQEVILSAGAFSSPQILMLSGVGDATELQKLGIKVVKDIPEVGKNLQSHVFLWAGAYVKSPALNPDAITPLDGTTYLLQGSGPIAAPAGLAGLGFLQSPYAFPAYPDLQLVQTSFTYTTDLPDTTHSITGLKTEVLKKWWERYEGKDLRLCSLILNRPRSRGTLELRDTNPLSSVKWSPDSLTNSTDVDALLWGFRRVLELYENTTALNTTMIPNRIPGCENTVERSDEDLRCIIKRMSTNLHHSVGTCAMGTVLTSKMKVVGFENLRVIDISAMPMLTSGNTYAPTIMIAEKGAQYIKDEHGL